MRSPIAYAPRPGPLGRRERARRERLPRLARGGRVRLLEPDRARRRRPRRSRSPGSPPERAGALLRGGALGPGARGDRDRRQRDRLPARRHDPAARRRAAGARPDRRQRRGAGRGRDPRPADRDRARRLRGALRLRRPRPDAAAVASARPPLGAHRDPDHAPGPARRGRPRAAARRAGAARPRRRRPPARAALARRLVAGSLDRAVDIAATLELRGYARGVPRRAGRRRGSRHGWRFARRRRRDRRRSGVGARLAGVGELRRLPDDLDRRRTRRRSRSPRRCRCSPRRRTYGIGLGRGGGLVAERGAIVRMGAFSYSLPRRGRPGADGDRARGRARASSWSSPGARARASRACCAPAAGWSRTTTAARSSGVLEVCGLDVREHGPAELGGLVGLVGQDPETQVVSATVRGELELPLELRGEPDAARARAIEEVDPGARRSTICSSARPTRSPAASCSGLRSPRRWSCARA